MYILLAVAAFTFMTHLDFKKSSDNVHRQLAIKTTEEIADGKRFDTIRPDIITMVKTGELTPKMKTALLKDGKIDLSKQLDPSQYKKAAQAAVATVDKGKAGTLGTIYQQMLVPVAIREMLPMGITGVLCALMIFLMVSTDTTYIHSWGSIIVQDIILPFRKTPFTPKQQLNLLRCIIAGVAVFSFLFSFFFAQMDYILMFFAITGAIWLGGAGPVITLGLYWKRGTTAGAFAALGAGSFLAVGGIICQQTWAKHIYPALEKYDLVSSFSWFFESVSKPFNPYIVWKVTPEKFPVNSQEIYFISMLAAIFLYVTISLLTCRQPFNIERMLHRGIYADRETKPRIPWTFRSAFSKIIGIDQNYTKGDKILAWSVFLWSFGYGFCLCFIGIIIWNAIHPWPAHWWAIKFHITALFIPCSIAIISTVWFSIGGTIDLIRLFKALSVKHDDFSDDGRVVHPQDDTEKPGVK